MPGVLRYLATDDDPAFLMVLGQMMAALGRTPPVTANSGPEALALLSDPAEQIDCILLDFQMPGMDGIEVCRRIRELPHHRDTPVMMVTTLNGRNHVDAAFAAGATDYLTKPLDRIELEARLGMMERLVAERRQVRELRAIVDQATRSREVRFEFADAVDLKDCHATLDFHALRNYPHTLNRMSLQSQMAVGFRIVGAERAFARLRPAEFIDYLTDVGDCIGAALKRFHFKLAYAGNGEFVACLDRTDAFDSYEVELEIARQLSKYEALYEGYIVPLPKVIVGRPVVPRLFSARSSDMLLQEAIAAIRPHVSPAPRLNRRA